MLQFKQMKAQATSKRPKQHDKFAPLRWVILVTLLITALLPTIAGPLALIIYLLPAIFVFLHGARYLGGKNILIFFVVTYIVTFIAEYLGVNTGHIFGSYYYNLIGNGPLLGGVPVLLMLTYFSLAYSSYLVIRIILGWLKLVKGLEIVILSLLSGMLMTLSDLANDPINSTVDKIYIWTQGGIFFGVPYQNFTGWLGETVVLFLIISLILGYITKSPNLSALPSRRFLTEPIVLFIIPVVSVVLSPLLTAKPTTITEPMSLIALFGLGTIALLALARVATNKHHL